MGVWGFCCCRKKRLSLFFRKRQRSGEPGPRAGRLGSAGTRRPRAVADERPLHGAAYVSGWRKLAMAARKEKDREPSFEERMARLQAVVERLESPDVPLEESMALYKEGCELARLCREQVDKARSEVRLLAGDGTQTPFMPEDDTPRG